MATDLEDALHYYELNTLAMALLRQFEFRKIVKAQLKSIRIRCRHSTIKSDWPSVVLSRQPQIIKLDGKMVNLVAIDHTSNRGMIARANLEKNISLTPLKFGLEFTMSDV
jgi:hypothetical protein